MTKQELNEIEARASAATEGKFVDLSDRSVRDLEGLSVLVRNVDGNWFSYERIAHARQDVPALVAEVRRLQDVVEQLKLEEKYGDDL